MGSLNDRNLFSHSSGGWKSKVKLPVEVVSSETSLLSLHASALSLLFTGCPAVCTHPAISLGVLISSYMNISQIGLEHTLRASCNLITSLKPYLQLLSHSEVLGLGGGLGLQHMNLVGDTIQSVTFIQPFYQTFGLIFNFCHQFFSRALFYSLNIHFYCILSLFMDLLSFLISLRICLVFSFFFTSYTVFASSEFTSCKVFPQISRDLPKLIHI